MREDDDREVEPFFFVDDFFAEFLLRVAVLATDPPTMPERVLGRG